MSVAIQRDDHVALSEIEARHHRSGLTGVSLEVDDPNSPIRICELVQNRGRVVRATVVDEDDFPRLTQPGELLSHSLTEFDQCLLFVVDGNNNGYQHRRQLPVRTLKVNSVA